MDVLYIKVVWILTGKARHTYFHSVLPVIWPLTLMKRAHLSDLFISRFSTYIRKPKAEHSISERLIREAKNPSSKWPGGHKSNAESKHIYCSFISIHYKLNLPRATDAKLQFASKISSLEVSKGLFTRYDFVACDKLTTGLRHDLGQFTRARHFHLRHAKIACNSTRFGRGHCFNNLQEKEKNLFSF